MFKKQKGGYLWDIDGNRFIDYRLAFGPIILGHAYQDVDAKVHEEIDKGVLIRHDQRIGSESHGKNHRHVSGD